MLSVLVLKRKFFNFISIFVVLALFWGGDLVAGKSRRAVDQEAVKASRFLEFPPGFKWCVATSAHQIEGGNTESDWWDWETAPSCRIRGCESSGRAADHWNRVSEDVELLKALNVRQYRLSIEWAKIEPKMGEWNQDAIAHYRDEITKLFLAGIEPMVTLHHFTLPRWFQALGGWTSGDAPALFENYTKVVYSQIAPEVRDWVTFNEPMVHLGGGYVTGITPPGAGRGGESPVGRDEPQPGTASGTAGASGEDVCRIPDSTQFVGPKAPGREDLARVIAPARGVLQAHARAYRALHELAEKSGRSVRVGMAHHLRVFDPRSRYNALDRWMVRILDRLWNWAVPHALETGWMGFSVPGLFKHSEFIPGLKGTQDFIGVNYYTRDIVWFKWDHGPSIGIGVKKGAPTNDMGWELYPDGLYRVLKAVSARMPGKAILITENGLADCADRKRIPFLQGHLGAVYAAIQDGVPVEGYCHWSLMDNFEWLDGFSPRFGLYEVNYSTFERKPRPSAIFYSDVARRNGLEL